MNEKMCRLLAAEIRLETLKVIHSRGFGHAGGSMDLADLMAVLYGEVMKYDAKNPRWEEHDWMVLSKGHAGPVAYAVLGLMGFYPMENAYTLNQPGTQFPSHTDRKLTPGVDLTTGSLGQGVSAATGAALGNRIDGHDVKAIYDAIQCAKETKGVPSCIVLNTCKGKGATFAEVKHDHSSQPNEEQWQEALAAASEALKAAERA